jgi:hypothetical protein
MIHKRCFCSLCILIFLPILFLSQGNAAEIYADPLFSHESKDEKHTIHALGPVLEFSPHVRAVRPFYYKDEETSEVDMLYPLGRFSQERGLFFPFYRHIDQEDQQHVDLFPVFYGKYKETPYWGIFPLYGTMEHRFGFKRARFILWPLYADTTMDETETYSFLWPVFSYSRGRLYRVFPLYGWEKTSDSTNQFFLWPFIHHERGIDNRRMDAVLPLFLYDRGPTHQSISFLWPFFTYNHDSSAQHISADFPWPIIRMASGAYEETRIFPLYWAKTEGKTYSRMVILWPLWSTRSWHYEDSGTYKETVIVLLTNWVTKETTRDGQTARRIILWPFLYTSSEADRSEWHFPSIFPLFFDKGFARTWGPLLSIAEGTSDGASSQTSILWRTIFWETKADTKRWSISFLASSTETSGYRQWGFLGNLLTFRQSSGAEAD